MGFATGGVVAVGRFPDNSWENQGECLKMFPAGHGRHIRQGII